MLCFLRDIIVYFLFLCRHIQEAIPFAHEVHDGVFIHLRYPSKSVWTPHPSLIFGFRSNMNDENSDVLLTYYKYLWRIILDIFCLFIFLCFVTTYNVIVFLLSCTWLLHMLDAIEFGYKMHSVLTVFVQFGFVLCFFLSTHTKSTILDCIDTTSINPFLYWCLYPSLFPSFPNAWHSNSASAPESDASGQTRLQYHL